VLLVVELVLVVVLVQVQQLPEDEQLIMLTEIMERNATARQMFMVQVQVILLVLHVMVLLVRVRIVFYFERGKMVKQMLLRLMSCLCCRRLLRLVLVISLLRRLLHWVPFSRHQLTDYGDQPVPLQRSQR
jgi:hypothetical protein